MLTSKSLCGVIRCESGAYAVRVMAASASAAAVKYNLTVQSDMTTVARREEIVSANGGQTTTRVDVAQGSGVASPADNCPELLVSGAPVGSIWEVSTVSSDLKGGVIASGRGGSQSSAALCLPSTGGEFRVRLYAGDTGKNLMADLSTTCQVRAHPPSALTPPQCLHRYAPSTLALCPHASSMPPSLCAEHTRSLPSRLLNASIAMGRAHPLSALTPPQCLHRYALRSNGFC
jgi:hypothetical protein